jgi:hypothetical protein
VEENINLKDAIQTLDKFAFRDEKTKEMIQKFEEKGESYELDENPIHEMIFTGKVASSKIYDTLKPIYAPGLLSTFNKS